MMPMVFWASLVPCMNPIAPALNTLSVLDSAPGRIDYWTGTLWKQVPGAVALDISGRPFLVWQARFTQEKLGEWDTELIEHWFHSVAQAAGITLHVQLLYGQNNHHVCEAIFKGFARAMRQAVELDPRKGGAIPSTKGQLGG